MAPIWTWRYYALKAAVAKGDVAAGQEMVGRTAEAARKVIAANKAPADDDAKKDLEYAKQVDEYSEYALYVLALKSAAQGSQWTWWTADQAESQEPVSAAEVAGSYFAALGKAGEGAKVCPAAERMSRAGSKNAEAMLVGGRLRLARPAGRQRSHLRPPGPRKPSTPDQKRRA